MLSVVNTFTTGTEVLELQNYAYVKFRKKL